ncbi:uncharacterized protein [Venturia canescens]|uniref:uncharacterized protein n=1 Tax=Venturia canescens TaxID=32260 RepID=UPI001C9D3FBC|nr:uncharacterized protein LOC122418477 [Venturia canescens]
MKLFLISLAILASLFSVSGESGKKTAPLSPRSELGLEPRAPEPGKLAEAQRKRDSGNAYVRPSKFARSQRVEPVVIRGRIVSRIPGGHAVRPFGQYGPPRLREAGGGTGNRGELEISSGDFPRSKNNLGPMRQGVPSPIRDAEFVEPSPIAGQNSVPFNSNSANYLPPRNQKLPSDSSPFGFSSQSDRGLNRHPGLQSQSLLLPATPQISDAAFFLSQNSQAISQLYEAPASSENQEPISGDRGFDKNFENSRPGGLAGAGFLRGSVPSYASGVLEREALEDIKSLEKDRLIGELQRALVDNRGRWSSTGTTRYAQNHENPGFAQSQSFFGFQGQTSPSAGPQLDRPSNSFERGPYGPSGGFVPLGVSSTPGYNYGAPSTTPPKESPSTTLAPTTPAPTQSINGAATSQAGNSISAPSGPPTLQLPQFGGLVPSLVNTNYLTNYPTYPGSFVPSGSSSINQVQSFAPTHFGIPIPSFPLAPAAATTSTLTSGHPTTFKPEPLPPNPPHQPLNPTFPLVPALNPIQPVQAGVTPPGHPTYGIQPANSLLLKPIKPLFPVYYYPNLYQIQKPAVATLPWNYAPAYPQIRPEAWK